jgi:RNA polymerase sigma-70 factor (ECF subfamily)
MPEPSPADRTQRIVREHGRYVWRVLRYLGVPERDVADVAQDVFVTVHRRIGEFEARSSIRTWLYAICVRTAANHRRKLGRRREQTGDSVPEPLAAPDQLRAMERADARRLLNRLLDRLDDDKRAVFVLHEIERLPMQDVVEVLGIALGTGYSRLRAARKRMDRAARQMSDTSEVAWTG